jgi:hypothetical protein
MISANFSVVSALWSGWYCLASFEKALLISSGLAAEVTPKISGKSTEGVGADGFGNKPTQKGAHGPHLLFICD